jgi:hypothetical protein
VVAAATGAKFKLIEGYAGNPAVRLAVDQKELDGACWTVASMKTTAANWFEGNPPPMTILLQVAKQPYSEIPNVPLIRQYIKDPSLTKMVDVLENASVNVYLSAFPPGVPADRVAALRDAWLKTWNDPDLKTELAKTAFKFSPVSGQDTEKVINEFLAMSADESKTMGRLFGLID